MTDYYSKSQACSCAGKPSAAILVLLQMNPELLSSLIVVVQSRFLMQNSQPIAAEPSPTFCVRQEESSHLSTSCAAVACSPSEVKAVQLVNAPSVYRSQQQDVNLQLTARLAPLHPLYNGTAGSDRSSPNTSPSTLSPSSSDISCRSSAG